jgi:hypothetical protein
VRRRRRKIGGKCNSKVKAALKYSKGKIIKPIEKYQEHATY